MIKRCLKFAVQVVAAIAVSNAHAGAYEDFFRALALDDASTVQQLLQRGFDPNTRDEKGQMPLYLSQREGAAKVAQLLLSHPDLRLDLPNAAGETPLMMAALRGNAEWVTRLLDRGARIEGATEPGQRGWTPLHYAAAAPAADAIGVLLARGARVDAEAPNGTTALMMAAQYGTEAAVDALLKQGADPRRRNDLNLGVAEFAERSGRESLVRRLQALAR